MKNGELADCLKESMTRPAEKLVTALDKKLTATEALMLRHWLDEERRAAADAEWDRQKDRIRD